MNSAPEVEKLRSRKHTLEDLIDGIVRNGRRMTPQRKQLLRGYQVELAEIREAIAMHAARAS